MSINATLKANLPKNVPTTRNSFNIVKQKEELNVLQRRKTYVAAKSQKIEFKAKSKLAFVTNENDQNSNNIKMNLNNEFFGKRISLDEKNISIEPEIKIDTDLNVTMKSSKDDSALKENEVEKTLRENVLGGLAFETIPEKMKISTGRLSKTIKNIKIDPVQEFSSSSLNYENIVINKELSPKWTTEEYRRMCTLLVKKDYHTSIMKSIFEEEEVIEDCLAKHKITERMRCRMIDWIIEVLSNYKCEDSTFFVAVNIMDKYCKAIEKTKSLQPSELHLIGVTSMFLASKFQDIYPLRLKTVYEKIAHKKLSMQDIKIKEEEITKTLNYIIGKVSQWEFTSCFIEELFYTEKNNYFIKDKTLSDLISINENTEKEKIGLNKSEKIYSQNMINLLKHVAIYLAKMNCHDIQLANKKPSLLAAGTIFVSMKICEQINKEDYVTDHFTKRLVEVSNKNESDIIKCAQKILHNAQNFDTIFAGLENLKRVHFNAIIELTNTK